MVWRLPKTTYLTIYVSLAGTNSISRIKAFLGRPPFIVDSAFVDKRLIIRQWAYYIASILLHARACLSLRLLLWPQGHLAWQPPRTLDMFIGLDPGEESYLTSTAMAMMRRDLAKLNSKFALVEQGWKVMSLLLTGSGNLWDGPRLLWM